MIGVSYNDFWDLSPKSLEPFIKAFVLKNEYHDRLLWEMGIYIQNAITSCFSKNNKYPKKPIFTKERELTTKQKEELIKERLMRDIERMEPRFRKEV